jgi:hypothetical protein
MWRHRRIRYVGDRSGCAYQNGVKQACVKVEPHGDGAFVVAEKRCGKRLSKTKVAKEEAQVESLLGALRQSVVFSLLSAEAHRVPWG